MPSHRGGVRPERGELSLSGYCCSRQRKCTDDRTLASLPARPSACEHLSNPVYCYFQLAPKAVAEIHFASVELFAFRLRSKYGKFEPVKLVGRL